MAHIVSVYSVTAEPEERAALSAELATYQAAQSVPALVHLLRAEQDPYGQQGLLNALATIEDREAAAPQIAAAVSDLHSASPDAQVRSLALEVLAEVPTPEAVAHLRKAVDSTLDPVERLTAMESLLRISVTDPELVPAVEVAGLEEQVRAEAQADGTDPTYQAQAIMALAGRKEENQPFFQQMLNEAQDANVSLLLTKLTH